LRSFHPCHHGTEQKSENKRQSEWNQNLLCEKERSDDDDTGHDPGQIVEGMGVTGFRHLKFCLKFSRVVDPVERIGWSALS
jgi:hypothetical protein